MNLGPAAGPRAGRRPASGLPVALAAMVIVGWIIAIVSFVMFLSGKERRSLHDSIAGTVVLYDPNRVLQILQYRPVM